MTPPAGLPFPVPPADRVFVERFAEPITGWPMLGAGAVWTAPAATIPLEVEVRYDGSPRVTDRVTRTADGEYHFGTQLPIEPTADRVTVVLRGQGAEVVLHDGPLSAVRERGAASPAPKKPVPRWLSPAVTFGRSVSSGECFTAGWWAARARRYRDLTVKARQKVRDRRLLRGRFPARSVHDAYVENTRLTPADLAAMRDQATRFRHKPTISLLCPVYNVAPRWLAECVVSVLAQAYPHWQLCLADDASTDPATRAALDRLPKDARIKMVRRSENGHICHATNSAADQATGEFVALLDNDDLLAPHALFRVAERLQTRPDADLIYSDEDKIDAAGRRYDPQFKPGWSPELLLSYNYVNHFTVIRRTVFEAAGRFRPGFEGSQDHDLLLRVTERTDRVEHVPEILYHWRSLPTSTAGEAGVKPYVHTSGRKAAEEALTRRRIAASLYVPPFAERLNLPVLTLDGPDDGPSVAVIIRGEATAASRTARAVKQRTAYRNHSTYLVIDGAAPADALNRLAAGRTEDLLCFLEAGVEPCDPRWLSRLVAHARLADVGCVGGLVTDPDGRIVSAGTVLGMADGTAPGDAFRGLKPDPVSYYFYAEVTRTVSAPARGCQLVRRDLFDRLGGFDADRFGHTLYDADFALRAAGHGFRSVHVGGVVLTGGTGRHDAPTEQLAFRTAHGDGPDLYHNPNLSNWDSFTPRPDAPHLLPAEPADRLPVLFGTHNLSAFEGAPKVIQEVAVGLHQQGAISASVFAPAPGKAVAAFDAAGVPVSADETPFGKRFIDGQWTPSEYAAAVRHVGRLIRKHRPRVVVANTLGLFPMVEAAARAGVPAVLAIQESYPDALLSQVFSPYGRWRCERAFQFADRVVFASRGCAALYERLNSRKNFEVIHNGLSAGPFDDYGRRVSKADAKAGMAGPPGVRYRIVAVGTVCERKAQHLLVEAAAELAKARSDFAVYLVGAREGLPYLSYVCHLAAARGVADRVIPVGETPDVWRYLRAADVFVCCSYIEAYSVSVMEALAFGLPVVSTPAAGLDEQVAWGHNALRFDFGDSAGLAKTLADVLRDDPRRAEMGRQSRAAFDLRLTADGMLDRYLQVIRAAAGPHPAAATARRVA
ncbi:MAG: glycosyltransferase [Gemmataceae bacterium]